MTQQDEDTLTLLPPDPGFVALVGSFIRCALQVLSGAGLVYGTWDDQQVVVIASVVVAMATLGWSFWQKVQAKRNSRRKMVQTARMSAASGRPTVATLDDGTC